MPFVLNLRNFGVTSCLATFSDLAKGEIISAHTFLLKNFFNCSSTLPFLLYINFLCFGFPFHLKFKVYGEACKNCAH